MGVGLVVCVELGLGVGEKGGLGVSDDVGLGVAVGVTEMLIFWLYGRYVAVGLGVAFR